MPRENPFYRLQLEQLITAYPDRRVWRIKDICEYEGITRATANARYGNPGPAGYTTSVYAQLLAARQWNTLGRTAKETIREISG
jgi:hypothetical protein